MLRNQMLARVLPSLGRGLIALCGAGSTQWPPQWPPQAPGWVRLASHLPGRATGSLAPAKLWTAVQGLRVRGRRPPRAEHLAEPTDGTRVLGGLGLGRSPRGGRIGSVNHPSVPGRTDLARGPRRLTQSPWARPTASLPGGGEGLTGCGFAVSCPFLRSPGLPLGCLVTAPLWGGGGDCWFLVRCWPGSYPWTCRGPVHLRGRDQGAWSAALEAGGGGGLG